MSYEPSHRKPPPQERWLNATPDDGWPAYASGSYGATPAYSRPGTGYDAGTGSYPVAGDSYLDDGYAYQDDYRTVTSGAVLIAPDTLGQQWLRQDRDQDEGAGRDSSRAGPVAGAVTGFLAAAVAIGVATFAAAFVRPQASPIIAVGEAFIDRTPPALKNFAVGHFGENDKTVLLGGMYVTIAGLAMVLGFLARRNVTIGVVGVALFGLFGAFVAITRPESRASDVIPSVIGALAGVAAFLWLARASAPVASRRPAYSGGASPARAYGGRRRRAR